AAPEVKPEPAPKKESEIQKINRQIAANNRIQKKLQQEQAAIEAAKAQLAEKEQKLADLAKLDELSEIELLNEYSRRKGISPIQAQRDLLAKMAGVYQEEPETPAEPELDPRVKAEVEAAKKAVEDLKAQLADKEAKEQQAQLEALVSEYGDNAMALVSDDDYPLLSAKGIDWVREQFLEYADKYSERTKGKVVEPKELLDYMEMLQEEEAERVSAALTRKKSGGKPNTEAQASTPPDKGASSPATSKKAESKPTALTTSTAAERSGSISSGRRTERERRQAAVEYLKTRV
ncbi:MAG: hypothetical protein KGL39_47475, partial [Patescibacteria group bacterium]|nr:hypothetical protein [Patescibacteria group bacterium]